jgi:hypothetical protein
MLSNLLLARLTPYAHGIIGDHQCGFEEIRQLLIIYSAFIKYLRKMGTNKAMYKLFIDFTTTYSSVKSEVLYNVLLESGITMEPVRLIN